MAHQRAVHKFTNALIHETSPYLLQHAHNPVDWLPWGQEAFQKAKTEQKPIFLSIGYSTCHWCHVMERESFESEQTAQLMNKHFVNIKVDREERPDVDRVYMSFVQATTGGGGWPLNVFLTPNLAPFFGGTYFPPNDTMYSGTPGFPQLLLQISTMWKNDRAKLEKSGEKIIEALKSTSSRGSTSASASTAAESWLQDKDTIYDNVFQQAIDSFLQDFDRKFGGFGNAPKFPRPVILNFLFRMHYLSTVDKKNRLSKQTAEVILHSCLFTLEKMAQGGMYDQLGSGFHRYSVDKEWHVPHFEKMTYDQGQLICSYVEAYQVSKKNYFANIARDVIEYMTRDMMVSWPPTSQDKSNRDMIAFYSAEDADSYPTHDSDKKREGAFYAWSYNELKQLLSNEAVFGAEQDTSKKNGSLFDLCKHVFGVEMNGNVKPRSDPHGEFRGLNILIQRCSIEEAAEQFGTSEQQIEEALGRAKFILMKERSKRPRPHLDDKIIVSWNALMISGLARAAQVLSEEKYAQLGEQAARFIKNVLYNAQKKTLYRTYRRTESSSSDAPSGLIDGFLSDYCNMVSALLDLYEATANIEWLEWALELQERQDELFLDHNNGGYFEVTGQDPSILLRMKEDYDGAEPSGNSISAMNLLRLSQYQTNKAAQILAQVDKLFTSEHEMLNEMPVAVPQMLCALDERLNPGKHIAIVYNNEIGGRSALIDVQKTIFSHHIPSKSLFYVDLDDDKVMTFVKDNMPYLSEASIKNGKPTVYICQNFACQAPVTDLNELNKILVKD